MTTFSSFFHLFDPKNATTKPESGLFVLGLGEKIGLD